MKRLRHRRRAAQPLRPAPLFRAWGSAGLAAALAVATAGCRSPEAFRAAADRAAYDAVARAQTETLGRTESFTVELPSQTLRRRLLLEGDLPRAHAASLGSADVPRIPQWPDPRYGSAPTAANSPAPGAAGAAHSNAAPALLTLTLIDALQVAARGSREYQSRKEAIFEAALKLDLERNAFRRTWAGRLEGAASTDGSGAERVDGAQGGAALELQRKLQTGGAFTFNLGLDLVKLLTQDKSSSLGLLADATLSLPLLRGAGRFVAAEPLTQAERDVAYAIWEFEQFKRSFAVDTAAEYLRVLQQLDSVGNARENYESVARSTRRAQRFADAGRLPAIQVDQARQDELRARNRWIAAQSDYERRLDAFKLWLGLPADAALALDRGELERLVARGTPQPIPTADAAAAVPTNAPDAAVPPAAGGPLELDERRALELALAQRTDLRVATERVQDAQRAAAVAADRLRADATLLGRGAAGSGRTLATAGQPDARLDASAGRYSAALRLDLPLERTAERNAYRSSLLAFEKAVRDVQDLEDRVKAAVRQALRTLRESREAVAIQQAAVEVAQRRRDSTSKFLEAGRAEIRDVLEAEEALLSAQNGLSAALVNHRIAELQLQRDMGVLRVQADGLWQEYTPPQKEEPTP